MDDIIYGPAVVGYGMALVVFEVVVLVIAVRRHRAGAPPPPRLHAIAGAVIAVLPALVALSVHAARALMFSVAGTVDPGEKAAALARGMSGQMSAIPFAVTVIGLAAALWFAGLAYTMSARRADGRARGFPPAALVAVGLAPMALGAIRWSTGMVTSFAAMAGESPQEKLAMIERALEIGRTQLTHHARISMITIPILAVIAVVLIVARDRDRDGAPAAAAAPSRSPRLPLAVSASAVLLAALLLVVARPMAAENDLPWPPSQGTQLVSPGPPPTPDLTGPDAPDRAPVVEVFRDRLGLDGMTVADFEALESMLTTLRNNHRLLHPSEDFPGMALILADPATPIPRLTSALRAICSARYHRPMFAFAKKEAHVRPVIGNLERVRITGARLRMTCTEDEDDDEPGEWKNAVPLRLSDFADHGAFARRLVELRRAGKPVIVNIDQTDRSPR